MQIGNLSICTPGGKTSSQFINTSNRYITRIINSARTKIFAILLNISTGLYFPTYLYRFPNETLVLISVPSDSIVNFLKIHTYIPIYISIMGIFAVHPLVLISIRNLFAYYLDVNVCIRPTFWYSETRAIWFWNVFVFTDTRQCRKYWKYI